MLVGETQMEKQNQEKIQNIRLGIAKNGRLIHEEIVRPQALLTVGTDRRATIQLQPDPQDPPPELLEILQIHHGQLHLVAQAGIQLSLRGTNVPEPLVLVDERQLLPLGQARAGSLTFGKWMIMFKFVTHEAPTLATRREHALRLGLVHDDRLICDQLIPAGQTVQVGNDRRATLVLPEDDYRGPPLTLRCDRHGQLTLKGSQNLELLVVVEGRSLDLPKLLQSGRARLRQGQVTCALPAGTRGRVQLGEHTLLLHSLRQTVTTPILRKTPLPLRLVAPLRADPVWSLSLTLAALLCAVVVGEALLYRARIGRFQQDPVAADSQEILPVEIAEFVLPEPEKPEKPVEKMPELVPHESPQPLEPHPESHPTLHTARTASHDEVPRPTVRTLTVADALRGKSGLATQLFQDAPGAEARQQAAFGPRTETEPGAGPGQGARLEIAGTQHAVEKIEGRGQFAEREARQLDVRQVAKKQPIPGPLAPDEPDRPEPTDEKGKIAAKVRGRHGAVKACYDAALRQNPDLGGKVKVAFTVGTAGSVTEVNVLGAEAEFAECIRAKFLAIRGLPILNAPLLATQTFVFSRE